MLGDAPEQRYGFGVHAGQTDLWWYLLLLNIPAVLITNLLSSLAISLFQLDSWFNFVYSVIGIICVTLQWLCVGKCIQFLIVTHYNESLEPVTLTVVDRQQ